MAARVLGSAQEIEHTASRRSGPRRWLRAVGWWIVAADLHPRTGATVQRIAEDLAGRMDFSTGHARYCLEDTAARLGIDKATVKRRVKQLREAGLLAWVQHGTRSNVRRLLGLPGYAGTATVYAAVIPPSYDQAHGLRRIGTGYTTRIVVPHPNGGARDAPPSLTVVKEVSQVEVDGGCNYTSRQRASRKDRSIPRQTRAAQRSKVGGAARRSPVQVARDCRIAAQVRPRVGWTQFEGIRRLAFALRPWIDGGLDVHDIAAELNAWGLAWRPERPAAYIRARIAQNAAQDAALAAAGRPQDNADWCAWWAEKDQRNNVVARMLTPRERTDADRHRARQYACADLEEITDHIEAHGFDDALDLYGDRLVSLAGRMAASTAVTTGGTRW